ncbi:MAG TPA: hypothetical protein VEY67_05380 [Candidatus Dormibacteraeota bacterium]|nr:hypothetical protein [Candidatus Dormibacteraeota bacterium]
MRAARVDMPAAFETIADALEEPAGRARFMRGLVLGSLVGAAIVGSLVRARHGRKRPAAAVERSSAGQRTADRARPGAL